MSVSYLAHGATLTFAWFVAINALLCVASALIASLMRRANSLQRSPRFWMAVRLLPAAIAGAFALALFVPSYWQFEPREAVEGFDLSLTIFALIGAVLVIAAIARGIAAWTAAARRVLVWMRHSQPLAIADGRIPAALVDAPQPMIALVGVFRPRLLVTRGLIDALTRSELEAVVAHEMGHYRAFDNLTRLLMRAAPDFLTYLPMAKNIEHRWAAAAEHSADRIGGPDATASRCALASALVKVARLTPPSVPLAEPISTLISGGDIASRVQTLLNDEERLAAANRWPLFAAATACLGVASVAYVPLLRSVHEITEVLVRSLP